jgi:hypothetical protein
MARVGYSGARGEGGTDLWKNIKLKISCQIHIKFLKMWHRHHLSSQFIAFLLRWRSKIFNRVRFSSQYGIFKSASYVWRPSCLPSATSGSFPILLSAAPPPECLHFSLQCSVSFFCRLPTHFQIFCTSFEAHQAKSNLIVLLLLCYFRTSSYIICLICLDLRIF